MWDYRNAPISRPYFVHHEIAILNTIEHGVLRPGAVNCFSFVGTFTPKSYAQLPITGARSRGFPSIGRSNNLPQGCRLPITHTAAPNSALIPTRSSRIFRSLVMMSSTNCAGGRCSKSAFPFGFFTSKLTEANRPSQLVEDI